MAQEAVLFANEAFYRAFAERDIAAMEQVWAQAAPVACIHPGWSPVVGRERVLASWRAILGGPGAPPITCVDAAAHVLGDAAFVICIERIPAVELVATNCFVREDDTWRMVHHHASGMARGAPEPEQDEPDSGSGLLH